MNILDQIVDTKKTEVERLKQRTSCEALTAEAKGLPRTRGFVRALTANDRMAVIAEIKKASPSKGLLRPEFDPVEIAKDYRAGGANALSVLTDEQYFQGHPGYLQAVREEVKLPLLRKDFIIDPIQVPESRLLGADAILLIAAILTPDIFSELHDQARALGLDVLAEVHTQVELEWVRRVGANLIGINNRDLKTFNVDLQTSLTLAGQVPEGPVLVSESGIRCCADLDILKEAGFSAVLVGETLVRQENVTRALKQLRDPKAPTPVWD